MIYYMKGYSDPNNHTPRTRLPALNATQTRMWNSIAKELKRTNREFLRKEWLVAKTKTEAKILVGRGKYNPRSGDLSVEFHTKTIKL